MNYWNYLKTNLGTQHSCSNQQNNPYVNKIVKQFMMLKNANIEMHMWDNQNYDPGWE